MCQDLKVDAAHVYVDGQLVHDLSRARNPPMPISIAGITLAKATMLVSRSALILANAASSCPHHQRASVECLLQLLMDSSSTNAALSIFLALQASLYSYLVGVASTIVHRPHHPTTGARKVPAEATATNKRPAMERDAVERNIAAESVLVLLLGWSCKHHRPSSSSSHYWST